VAQINLIRFRGKRGQETKRCPECQEVLPLDAFWFDVHRSDGLFAYCSSCAITRKRKMRERKREAMAAIVAAGERCAAGAKLWDHHITGLVHAWREMFEADVTMRTSRYNAGIDVDGGRIEIRLIHPRALYVLGLALQEAQCPWPTPLIRTEQIATTLAGYVGDAPQQDYVGAETAGESSNDVQEGRPEASEQRAEAGRDEQGNAGVPRNRATPARRKQGKRAPLVDAGGRRRRHGRQSTGPR
jgi:hypothetical protein